MSFEPKDIIRCINNHGYEDRLTLHKDYQVIRYSSDLDEVRIQDDTENTSWWMQSRFVLNNPPYKEGDTVRCIKQTYATNSLIFGNLYTVLEYSKSCDEIRIRDSMGGSCWWATYRFEKLTEDNMTKEQIRYNELQKLYVELTGLKKGDRIKVTHNATSQQNGWYCVWHEGLDNFVGKYAYLMDISQYGLSLSLDNTSHTSYNFPYFVVDKAPRELPKNIELPSGEYNVVFNEEGEISVGCQNIPYTTLKAIYEAATSTLES